MNIHYDLKSKTIVNQTIDMFNGIHDYKTRLRKNGKPEIYPFLEITQRGDQYDLNYIKTKIFDKYFSDFETVDRREKMINNMGAFDGNIDNFSGIKLYPPLGFDPWPDPKLDAKEHEKVLLIYT